MREQILARRNELKRQFDEAQIELQQVQVRENYLREAMLRVSGAMQVLDELLTARETSEQNGTDSHKAEPAANQLKGPTLEDRKRRNQASQSQ